MATEIDKRVVEMQFDNKDFEKNCQASLSTLEKLKMALNFDGAKGLDSMAKAANKIDLSGLSKGAEAIEVKFNAMNVAGMTAISELTKGFIGLGKTIWNVSFGQMKSGGMARTLKIEQANFQMKALARNIEQVKDDTEAQAALVEQMVKAASDAVQGTAYGMDSAAAVASQLMASGVTNAEKMLTHLKGVAGAAAMTGRSFDDIGNIFTTVASNGRLMTMQLRQFSAAGLNLSATLGQSLGKTEKEINEMVTKGQISFEMFSKALSDAFGEAAAEADNTFSGVTKNVKAQLSRIGQIFTDPYVKHMVPFLKEVKAAIKRINTVLQPLGKSWDLVFGHVTKDAGKALKDLELGRLRSIVYGLENIFASLFMIVDTVRKAFAELFPPKTVTELNRAATDFEIFTRKLIPTKETLDGLKQTLIFLMSPLRLAFNIAVSIWKYAIKPMSVVLTKLLGAILRLGNALKPLNDNLKKTLTECKTIDIILQIAVMTISLVVGWITQFISVLAELLGELAKNDVITKFFNTLKAIGDVIVNVVVGALILFYKLLEKIFSYLNIDNFVKFGESIYYVVEMIVHFIEQGLLTILGLIEGLAESSKIFGDIWESLKKVAELIKAIFSGENIDKKINDIRESLSKLGTDLKVLAVHFSEFLKEIGIGKIFLIAFATGIIFLVWSMKNLVDASTSMVKTVTSIGSVFVGFKKALATVAQYNGIFQILLGIAIAMAAFTSALQTVAKIPADDLYRAATVIGVFVVAMMGFAVLMTVLQKELKTDSKAAFATLVYVTGIAAAILFLALALRTLVSVEADLKKMVVPFLAVIGLMGSLVAACLLLSTFGKEVKVGVASIVAFSLSIKILVSALDQLTRINIEDINNTMVAFCGLLVTFGVAMGLASLGKWGIGAGLGFIGAATSILILIGILKSIGDYPYDEMIDGLKKAALLFLPLIALLGIAAAAQKISGRSNFLKNIAKTIFSFSFLLIAMLAIVELLGNMDPTALKQGAMAASGIGILLTMMIKKIMEPLLMSGALESPAKVMLTTKTVFALSSVITSITVMMLAMMWLVKSMGTPEAAKGIVPALLIIAGMFAGIAYVFKMIFSEIQNTSMAKVGPILAIVLAFLSILSAVTLLAVFMKPEELTKFNQAAWSCFILTIGLSILLHAYAGLSDAQVEGITPDRTKKTTTEILAIGFSLAAIIGAMGGLIYAFSRIPVDQLDKLVPPLIAMGAVIAAAAGFVIAADKIQNNRKFASNANSISKIMLGMAVIIGTMGATIAIIVATSKDIPAETLFGVIVGITIAFSVMGYVAAKMASAFSGIDGNAIAKGSLAFLSAAGAFVIIGLALTLIIEALKDVSDDKIMTIAAFIMAPFTVLLLGIALMLKLAQGINYEVFATEMMAIGTSLVLGASAFAIIAGALTIMAATTLLLSDDKMNILRELILWTVSFFVVLSAAIVIIMSLSKKFDLSAGDITKVSIAILLASAAFAVIAGAITVVALATNSVRNTKKLDSALGALVGSAVILFGGMAIILGVTQKMDRSKWKNVLAIGGAIAIASTAFAIVAASIAIVAEAIKNSDADDISKVMGIVTLAVIGMGAIFAIILAISKDIAGLNILSIGASFMLGAVGILIIVEAMKELSTITATIGLTEMLELAAIMKGMIVVFGAMAILGAVLGSIGAPAAIGVVMLVGAFAAFSAGVFLLAAATKIFLDAIEQINDAHLDADAIAVNTTNAIKGIAKAIYNCKDEILTAVGVIILGIMAIIAAQKIKMALEAVAFVTAFLVGLAAAMPIILVALDAIMDQINNYWTVEKGEQWETFGRNIGDLIVHGLIGAFKGLAQSIAAAIVESWEEIKNTKIPNTPFTIEQLANVAFKGYEIASGPLGAANAAIGTAKKIKQNVFDHIDDENLEDIWNEQIKDLRKISGKEFGRAWDPTTKTLEDWADIISEINRQLGAAKLADVAVSEEYSDFVKSLKIPEEYKKFIVEDYESTKEDILNALKLSDADVEQVDVTLQQVYASGPEQNIQTLTNDAYEASDAVAEIGTSAEETSEKLSTSGDFVDNLIGKVKEAAGGETGKEIGQNLLSGLESVFGSDGIFGSVMGDFDIGSLTKDAKIFGFTLGDAAGDAASKAMDDDMKSTIDYWTNLASIDNSPAFTQSKGLAKGNEAWKSWTNDKGEKFASKDEAAQYKLDKYMKETYGKTSVGYQSVLDYLGITEMLDGATGELDESLLGAADSLGELGDEADNTKSKFEEFTDNLRDSIANSLNIFDEVSEQEEISSEEMLDRMWENTRRVGQWARQISELAARGMSEGLLNELKDLGPQGAAKVDAFARMTQEQLMEANRLYADAAAMPDAATREIVQAYRDAGYNASLGFVDGIDTSLAKDAMTEMGNEGLDGLKTSLDSHSPSRETMKIGEFATEGFTIGMTDAKSQGLINKATKIVAALLMNGLRNDINPNKLRTVGENCMDGLVAGFNYKLPSTISRIQAIATQILSRFAQIFKINSPSKVFEEFGEMTMLGFSNGMDEGQSDVVSTTDKTANDILDAMKANIASITDGWYEDSAYEPVIRPVFDMSSISQGYSDIQTWFANAQGLNLNGNLSRLTPTTREDDTNTNQMLIDAINNLNNDDVVDELVALRNDISNLQSAMTNLQVVMNTGALVGQIIEPVDNALGAKALRNQRGRY